MLSDAGHVSLLLRLVRTVTQQPTYIGTSALPLCLFSEFFPSVFLSVVFSLYGSNTELELLITSVQIREPVTTPASRENAKVTDVVEGSSAYCNMAESELVKDLGEWKVEEDVIDLWTDLSPLLCPPLEPSVYPIFPSCPEKDCVPKSNPREPGGSQNCHPPTRSCLLLRSPSVLHLCGGFIVGLPVSIGIRLEEPSSPPPGLRLGPSTQWLHHGPYLPPLHPGPWSGVDHPAPQDSSGFTSSLWLHQAPPSLRLHLGPLSLQLHRSLPDPRLCVSRRYHLLHLGPPDPPIMSCPQTVLVVFFPHVLCDLVSPLSN
ncbi:hypothetical protein M9458_056328 [Cirrhinus mrigala]|uniref:Uncharacterized protein n=1 Tax=Cirrhinus mrigala TaxID=683832 RepID=A0ABD0MGZ1_CIRMR